MKSAKQEAIEIIDTLPDDVSTDVILEELLFVQTIKERIAEADRGETVSHDEVKKRLEAWRKSNGR
ncbi:MAG TPA: hypothetical protein VJB57_01665 [Dehalococcoidia bacterium]|nr:hypothetical protein [Dehalococcoidia bacterium]